MIKIHAGLWLSASVSGPSLSVFLSVFLPVWRNTQLYFTIQMVARKTFKIIRMNKQTKIKETK